MKICNYVKIPKAEEQSNIFSIIEMTLKVDSYSYSIHYIYKELAGIRARCEVGHVFCHGERICLLFLLILSIAYTMLLCRC